MLLVDRRAGSGPLLQPLLDAGVKAQHCLLPFGDFAWTSKEGHSIGVEYKTLGDLISSIRSGRLTGHQLPGMRAMYDYSILLVEGTWRHDEHGRVAVYKGPHKGWVPAPGRMSAAELDKRLFTLSFCAGVSVWTAADRRSTVRLLTSMYRFWTDGCLVDHTSHLAPHQPPSLVPLSPFREAVMMWPEIGLKGSLAAERAFRHEGKPSIRAAVDADLVQWADLTTTDTKGKTRKFGMKAAQKVQEFLN